MSTEPAKTCPRCGYDYEPWVDVCPDCGTPLVEHQPQARVNRGPLDPNTDPRWTVVTNVPNAIIGKFIKDLLEDCGIPVIMRRMKSVDIAEFSHNDFVPQDLLVPLEQWREARRLVETPPDSYYGPPVVEDDYDAEGAESESDAEDELEQEPSSLPPGWMMLPSEADLDARQQLRRTHGEAARGWYWSDESPMYEEPAPKPTYAYRPPWEQPEDQDYAPQRSYGPSMPYSYGPSRWIRVVYALLLLALSLPFLLQILGNIYSILTHFP